MAKEIIKLGQQLRLGVKEIFRRAVSSSALLSTPPCPALAQRPETGLLFALDLTS